MYKLISFNIDWFSALKKSEISGGVQIVSPL